MTISSFSTDSDRFEMVRQISAGPMATMFEAWDRKLERKVALKFLNLEQPVIERDGYDQILLEARAAARLDHANIATVYDVMTVSGKPCLVMEFIDGTSLSVLRGSPPLPFDELLRIAVAIARGLAAAHARGIIHRDIKPSNIMLARSGDVKIVDFGLARVIVEETLKTLKTSHISGTPAYMAPEVLMSLRPDASADIFSTGIVYYEICTGRYPFKAENFRALFDSIVQSELSPLNSINPQIPEWFSAVVRRMIAKDRRERYRSGVELLAALEPRPPSTAASSWAEGVLPIEGPKEPTVPASTMRPPSRARDRIGLRQWFSMVRTWLGR